MRACGPPSQRTRREVVGREGGLLRDQKLEVGDGGWKVVGGKLGNYSRVLLLRTVVILSVGVGSDG